MKYLKRYSQINESEKVRFFDKNGSFFSSGNGLSSIEEHKKRFGDDITFSVEGYDGVFNTLDEFKNMSKHPSNDSIFGDSKSAKERVLSKRGSKEQDIDFIMTKIKEEYSLEKAKEMFDDEVEEWIPEDKDIEWYQEHSNGEAQDVIISIMIGWFEENYNKISDDIYDKVSDEIGKHYGFLKISN